MLKKELERELLEWSKRYGDLKQENDSLNNYALQLQNKVSELDNLVNHYETSILVLAGRVQEKKALISEQKQQMNRRD